jgi:hypothetical protein
LQLINLSLVSITGGQTMFTKIAVAFAIVAVSATGSLAAAKKQQSLDSNWRAYDTRGAFAAASKPHSANPAWDVYDGRGVYIGSDPDSRIRADLLRGQGSYN